MEFRVYLTNGLVFRGQRGWREAMRECKGFHRFQVQEVENIPRLELSEADRTLLRWAAAHPAGARWTDLEGRMVVVNLDAVAMMVELG